MKWPAFLSPQPLGKPPLWFWLLALGVLAVWAVEVWEVVANLVWFGWCRVTGRAWP